MKKRLVLILVGLIGALAAAALASAAPAGGDPNSTANASVLDFSVCAGIGCELSGPPTPGLNGPLVTPGSVCGPGPIAPNTSAGSFSTSNNPFGLVVHISIPNMLDGGGNCILGAGVGYALNDLVVTVTGTTPPRASFTFMASTGASSVSVFPLDRALGPGTYNITVAFVGGVTCDPFHCSSWEPTSTTGTLVVVGVPPAITSLTATPNVLWPPNHKMVAVSLNCIASGDPSPTCQISSVTSNEASTRPGEIDWIVTGPLTVDLRAERIGSGDGRAYTITVACTNSVGSVSQTVVVNVPHDQGN